MKKPLVMGPATVAIRTAVMIIAAGVSKQGPNQEMLDGITYLNKMSENIQNLKIGLECQ